MFAANIDNMAIKEIIIIDWVAIILLFLAYQARNLAGSVFQRRYAAVARLFLIHLALSSLFLFVPYSTLCVKPQSQQVWVPLRAI